MSFDSIHEIFTGDLKEAYKFFFRKKFWQKFLPSQKFLPKHGFSTFQKGGKKVDNPQKYSHMTEDKKYVFQDLENSLKSIYPQFGRFRWPESADLADLTKFENFIFFDFLRSFFVHFMHCNVCENQNMNLNYHAENDHFTSISLHFTTKSHHFTL